MQMVGRTAPLTSFFLVWGEGSNHFERAFCELGLELESWGEKRGESERKRGASWRDKRASISDGPYLGNGGVLFFSVICCHKPQE